MRAVDISRPPCGSIPEPPSPAGVPAADLKAVLLQGLSRWEGQAGGSCTVPPISMSACTTNLQARPGQAGGKAGSRRAPRLQSRLQEWCPLMLPPNHLQAFRQAPAGRQAGRQAGAQPRKYACLCLQRPHS